MASWGRVRTVVILRQWHKTALYHGSSANPHIPSSRIYTVLTTEPCASSPRTGQKEKKQREQGTKGTAEHVMIQDEASMPSIIITPMHPSEAHSRKANPHNRGQETRDGEWQQQWAVSPVFFIIQGHTYHKHIGSVTAASQHHHGSIIKRPLTQSSAPRRGRPASCCRRSPGP